MEKNGEILILRGQNWLGKQKLQFLLQSSFNPLRYGGLSPPPPFFQWPNSKNIKRQKSKKNFLSFIHIIYWRKQFQAEYTTCVTII